MQQNEANLETSRLNHLGDLSLGFLAFGASTDMNLSSTGGLASGFWAPAGRAWALATLPGNGRGASSGFSNSFRASETLGVMYSSSPSAVSIATGASGAMGAG